MELSVIIPFVNEWPQVVFTIRSIAEELMDRVDFEIIAVENWCDEVKAQGRERQRGGEMIRNMSSKWPWLRYLLYDKKLSHWQCKNFAAKNSDSKFLCFIDAHCIVSRDALYKAFTLYQSSNKPLDGTLHLPLTYHILESKRLIYSLVYDEEKKDIHYRFSSYQDRNGGRPFEVPCMSTCGMLMTRELFDLLHGWPENMGIYGGGENYINFALSILGKRKWIMPGKPLCHHGDKRGYHWYGDDYMSNRLTAMYLTCGEDWAKHWWSYAKGHKPILDKIWRNVIESNYDRRQYIKSKQKIEMMDWLKKWGKAQ